MFTIPGAPGFVAEENSVATAPEEFEQQIQPTETAGRRLLGG
ncbi:MAG: hypothetical protein NUV34_02710 [Sulfuricaulis sp.]|nr:hypothetical protein [Sulfuricaulis sp.]